MAAVEVDAADSAVDVAVTVADAAVDSVEATVVDGEHREVVPVLAVSRLSRVTRLRSSCAPMFC